MISGRLLCCVPHCTRTRKPEKYAEWICGPHWRNVPQWIRARKFKAYRDYKRQFGDSVFWQYPGGSPQRIACVRASRECDDSWNECKRIAIEKAVGL